MLETAHYITMPNKMALSSMFFLLPKIPHYLTLPKYICQTVLSAPVKSPQQCLEDSSANATANFISLIAFSASIHMVPHSGSLL